MLIYCYLLSPVSGTLMPSSSIPYFNSSGFEDFPLLDNFPGDNRFFFDTEDRLHPPAISIGIEPCLPAPVLTGPALMYFSGTLKFNSRRGGHKPPSGTPKTHVFGASERPSWNSSIGRFVPIRLDAKKVFTNCLPISLLITYYSSPFWKIPL